MIEEKNIKEENVQAEEIPQENLKAESNPTDNVPKQEQPDNIDSNEYMQIGDDRLNLNNIDSETKKVLSAIDAVRVSGRDDEGVIKRKIEVLRKAGYNIGKAEAQSLDKETIKETQTKDLKNEDIDNSLKNKNIENKTKEEEVSHFLLNPKEEKVNIEIKTIDDLINATKKLADIDVDNIEQFAEIIVDYSKLREENKKYNSNDYKGNIINEFMDVLPDELFGLIQTWSNNGELDGDYRNEMKKIVDTYVDYTKEFSDYPKQDMLNLYFPGKFSAKDMEDYRDEDSDNHEAIKRSVDLALDVAKEKHEKNRDIKNKNMESYKEKYNKMLSEQQSKFDQSVESAISYLDKNGKDFPSTQKSEIINAVKNNHSFILDMYFNPDGSLKEDSLINLIYAKHGKEAIDVAKKLIAKKVEQKVNTDILTRGNDAPPTPRGSQSYSGLDGKQAKEYVDGFFGSANKQTF